MQNESLMFIFLNAAVINNFVLAMFLGICPFLGVSGKLKTSISMGAATTLVVILSSVCAYALNYLLVEFQLEFLRLISYIAVIASAVQLVEMVMKKFSPALFRALGIYLPLITTNCGYWAWHCFRPHAVTISPSRSPSAAAPAWVSLSHYC